MKMIHLIHVSQSNLYSYSSFIILIFFFYFNEILIINLSFFFCLSLRMEAALNDLLGKAEFLDHHVEHALASIDDHIANMIGKIEKREDKSESRIGDLESVSYYLSFF